MSIKRYPEGRTGRCAAVVARGIVYAVAVDHEAEVGISAQTRNALAEIERVLALAGSGKSGLLQATVYLNDMTDKDVMNDIWCNWVGPEVNWPQRACVGATLAPGHLIEIVVTALVLDKD